MNILTFILICVSLYDFSLYLCYLCEYFESVLLVANVACKCCLFYMICVSVIINILVLMHICRFIKNFPYSTWYFVISYPFYIMFHIENWPFTIRISLLSLNRVDPIDFDNFTCFPAKKIMIWCCVLRSLFSTSVISIIQRPFLYAYISSVFFIVGNCVLVSCDCHFLFNCYFYLWFLHFCLCDLWMIFHDFFSNFL